MPTVNLIAAGPAELWDGTKVNTGDIVAVTDEDAANELTEREAGKLFAETESEPSVFPSLKGL